MGKEKDFATGKRIDLSQPEEKVRQKYERVLVDRSSDTQGKRTIQGNYKERLT